jgi:hypothetical protein
VNRGLLAVLLACLLLASAGGAAAASSGGAFAQEGIEPDDVLLSITIEDDGDARWTIEYRTRLETDEDEQAFEELRSDIEADPGPYAQRFRDRMNGTARTAENATGREMAITGMNVSAERRDLPREYGILRYEFRWSNFAAVDGERLLVGDAIEGLFLDEETSLLLSWTGSHELVSASPEPTETRDGTVVYDGPIEFAGDEPRVELGPPGTGTGTGAGPPTDGGVSESISPLVAAALVVVLLAVVGGGVVAYRRRGGETTEESGATDATASEAADEEPPDTDLLSNEEQVLRLLEREGGRMKQQAVAEELGWTDAKTSQVTKKLREEGDLEGFRLGRENVLSLPDDESE